MSGSFLLTLCFVSLAAREASSSTCLPSPPYLSSLLSSSCKRPWSSSFSRMSSHCLRYCARGLSGKEVWRAFTPPRSAPPWGAGTHQGQSEANSHKSKNTPGSTLAPGMKDPLCPHPGRHPFKGLQPSLLLQGSGWPLCWDHLPPLRASTPLGCRERKILRPSSSQCAGNGKGRVKVSVPNSSPSFKQSLLNLSRELIWSFLQLLVC